MINEEKLYDKQNMIKKWRRRELETYGVNNIRYNKYKKCLVNIGRKINPFNIIV